MKIKPVLGILALIAFAFAAKSQTVETVVTNGLFEPYGVAVDLSTNIYYLTDSVNHRIVKYDLATAKLTTLTTFIGETNNFVGFPAGIVVARGGLVVSDSFNHSIYQIGFDGIGSVLAGGSRGLVNGPGVTAQFSAPAGLAADANGNIYIADSKNNAIRRLAPDNTVTTYATGFFEPAAVAVGDDGRVFVADTRNHVIKVIETNGSVSVVVGKLGISGADDGTSAGATLNGPRGLIWLGGDTGLLVADSGNDTIRRVYLKSGVWHIVTLAGSAGSVGLVDGPVLSARFNSPIGLALDLEGSVLVADLYNNALRSIKRAVQPLPTIVPTAGSFSNAITVTITSTVSNSVFYYSTNGSDPNPFSPVANGPLTFTGGPVALKVRAFSPDFATSATVSNNYAFFVNPLSLSVLGGSFDNDVDLTISTLTAGAVIRYTTDGSQPTTNSPVWTNRTFGLTSQLQVRGFRDGFDPTPIVNNAFTFSVSQPLIQPSGLATNDTVAITLSSNTKGAALFWTIDGTLPTTNSLRYSGPFILGTNGTLRVRGFKDGYLDSQISSELFTLAVGNPIIVPAGVATNNTVLVTLISATPQARLYWTLDGTVPSPANGFLYTSPFVLGTNGMLQVKGLRNGFIDSQTISDNFNLTVANPVIAPAGVTTNNTVKVTLTSATAGAQLYWTLDGTDPSPANGFLYTSPFVLGTNGTLQVKGFKNGFVSSQTISDNFSLTVANPVISPAGAITNNTVKVTLTSATAGAQLYWTLDGTDPSPSNGSLYTSSFVLGTNGTLQVKGVKNGFIDSQIVSNNFNLTVASPVISPAGATTNNTVNVTLTSLTAGARLYWTIDGTVPSPTDGILYTNTFVLATNGTLQVKGFKNGFIDSQTISNNFNLAVANPVISPAGATTNNTVNVTLTSLTAGAQLYWTINGTEPAPTNGFLYTSSFVLGTNGTLQVKGVKNGFVDSQAVSNNFNLTVANPVISPAGAITNNTVNVTLTSLTAGAELYWTINGTEPAPTNGFLYTSSFVLGTNGTLQVKGFKNGFVDSQTVSNNFSLTVANPVISPAGSTTNNTVNVTLTSLTAGARLYWTIDGTEPSPTNGILYSAAFMLGTNGTLQVKGFKNGFIDSQSVSNTFNLAVANPIITPGSGTSINSVQIVFSSATTNSTYYFTSDGTEPTINSTRYSGSLTLVTNTQLKVVGLRDGFVKSATISGNYFIQVDKPTMSPGTGFFPNGTTVTLTVARADAKIYYTLNGQDPTPNDQLYTGPFTLNQVFNQGSDLRVVKARAFAPNTLPSDIVSGQPVDTNSIGIPRDVVGGVGASIVVPLVVNLQTNQVLRSLQFRFEVFPNSPTTSSIPFDLRALAITGNDFVQVVGPSQGSSPAQLNTSAYRSGSTNGLVVSAIGTNANFVIRDFGTVALLAITIPPTANVDDSYTIQVVQASGTSDGQQTPVRLALMGSRTITVKNIPYVVGDSSPGTWYNAGDFGDGNLDNSDVNNAFYASLGIRVPYAFSDVFDAMDAFPDDTNGAVGGDGQIRFLDWQRILSRSLRRDANNWRRSWAGGGFRVANTVALIGSPNTPAQTLSSLPNGVAWLRQALLGALSLENVNPNGTVDVPVYVDVKPGYSLAGLQFRIAVESDGPSLEQPAQFISAPGLPQPISVDGLPGNQVVGAWPLVPSPSFNPALQRSNLLGHVRFTIPATARASQCYTVRFLTTDGSPDENTQYDLESVPGCVWVQSGALKLPDRISDEWKTNFFGSVSSTLAEADADPDGDGVPNWQEFLAGTSPAKLLLHIADINPNAAGGAGFRLRWFAAPGKHYVLECSSDLAGTNWRVIADNLAGQGDIKEFIDTNRTHAAQFYRVRVKP